MDFYFEWLRCIGIPIRVEVHSNGCNYFETNQWLILSLDWIQDLIWNQINPFHLSFTILNTPVKDAFGIMNTRGFFIAMLRVKFSYSFDIYFARNIIGCSLCPLSIGRQINNAVIFSSRTWFMNISARKSSRWGTSIFWQTVYFYYF